MREEPHTTITISRQLGSGGSYVGYLVAKGLGFRYVDREILRLAAEHLGTDTSVLESHDGKSCGLIDNLVRAFSFGTPETAYIPPVSRPIYDKDLFTLESRIMHQIADRYNAVIAGRAGFHVLRGRPGVIHIFIHAPLEFRIQRVMQVQHITDAREARTKVEEADHARSKFVRDMVGVDWTDARNFHLCIDAGTAGFHASAEMIIKLVELMEPVAGRGVRLPGSAGVEVMIAEIFQARLAMTVPPPLTPVAVASAAMVIVPVVVAVTRVVAREADDS